MLDKKYTQAYNSVVAGEKLKNKILLQAEENFQNGKRASNMAYRRAASFSFAACFVLLLGLGVFMRGNLSGDNISVISHGKVIGENAEEIEESGVKAVSFGTKSVKISGLPLELQTDGTAKISVSTGELYIFGDSYDDLLFIGTFFTTDRDVLIYWKLSDVAEKEPMLYVDSNEEHYEYTLQESEDSGYVIKLTVKESQNKAKERY